MGFRGFGDLEFKSLAVQGFGLWEFGVYALGFRCLSQGLRVLNG